MTDYTELRAALEAGPTPGPWTVRYDYVVQATSFDGGRLVPVAQPYGVNSDGTGLFANARMIAACHPEAIRALLAERDALLDQHHRDSKELRRLCAQRDAARKVSKEAGAVIAALKAERDALREALLLARDRIESERRSGEFDPLLRDIEAALAQEQGGSDA